MNKCEDITWEPECITCYWAYRICWENHQKIGCKAQGRKYVPNWWMVEREFINDISEWEVDK